MVLEIRDKVGVMEDISIDTEVAACDVIAECNLLSLRFGERPTESFLKVIRILGDKGLVDFIRVRFNDDRDNLLRLAEMPDLALCIIR